MCVCVRVIRISIGHSVCECGDVWGFASFLAVIGICKKKCVGSKDIGCIIFFKLVKEDTNLCAGGDMVEEDLL